MDLGSERRPLNKFELYISEYLHLHEPPICGRPSETEDRQSLEKGWKWL